MQHFHLDTVPSSWSEFIYPSRRISALSHDREAYYHSHASLLFDNGNVLRAAADEHCLAHLFDCFTLSFKTSTDFPQTRPSFPLAFEIREAFALIRDEWLTPLAGADDEVIGNNPHIHDSGVPGSAPANAVVLATCLAGVLLVDRDGYQMGLLASSDVPLNIDVVTDGAQVEELVFNHECRSFLAEGHRAPGS